MGGSGDEEGGCHEEGRDEGCSDEGCHEGEEGGQRDEEGSDEGPRHEEGHEEGQGDRGGMRESSRTDFKAFLLTRSWRAVVDTLCRAWPDSSLEDGGCMVAWAGSFVYSLAPWVGRTSFSRAL